ncbi:DUF6508 domain-containing protein [Tomitella gaofuii]|uniref:DUF6508 domain-containing protein n=1 Tax=Tomitella gaofuii TaxID=2760083 RepID=UPI0015FDEDD2|nr:DUF6508 domain-containing protein [Tomitella gaofuii]
MDSGDYPRRELFDDCDPSPEGVVARLDSAAWGELAWLARRIAEHAGPFGCWATPRDDDGRLEGFAYPETVPLVADVGDFCYQRGLVLAGFRWTEWDRGQELVSADTAVSVAEVPARVVLALLTVAIRGERFSTGAVLGAFESGLIPRLLKRLLEFASEKSRD